MRQLRGAVLRECVSPTPPTSLDDLAHRVEHLPLAAQPGAVEQALAGLQSDGLLRSTPWPAG
jgi:hypothetical protein